ncbi:hypothetical protein [Ancylobacter sp. IITR112]
MALFAFEASNTTGTTAPFDLGAEEKLSRLKYQGKNDYFSAETL